MFNMNEELKKSLESLNDSDLFSILDAVSDEVKRRNSLLGPSVTDIKNQPIEKSVNSFLEALADIGIKIKSKNGTTKT